MTPGEVSRMLAALSAIVEHLDQLPRMVALLEQLVGTEPPGRVPPDDRRRPAFDYETSDQYGHPQRHVA
ncbi:MAG: hypothetical protein GEU81_09660 [Nitriliruptorales bacterium]|nr:hypothetical protein [Nitriliruptorales bacterium]